MSNCLRCTFRTKGREKRAGKYATGWRSGSECEQTAQHSAGQDRKRREQKRAHRDTHTLIHTTSTHTHNNNNNNKRTHTQQQRQTHTHTTTTTTNAHTQQQQQQQTHTHTQQQQQQPHTHTHAHTHTHTHTHTHRMHCTGSAEVGIGNAFGEENGVIDGRLSLQACTVARNEQRCKNASTSHRLGVVCGDVSRTYAKRYDCACTLK